MEQHHHWETSLGKIGETVRLLLRDGSTEFVGPRARCTALSRREPAPPRAVRIRYRDRV